MGTARRPCSAVRVPTYFNVQLLLLPNIGKATQAKDPHTIWAFADGSEERHDLVLERLPRHVRANVRRAIDLGFRSLKLHEIGSSPSPHGALGIRHGTARMGANSGRP
jgi:hypothetical protein